MTTTLAMPAMPFTDEAMKRGAYSKMDEFRRDVLHLVEQVVPSSDGVRVIHVNNLGRILHRDSDDACIAMMELSQQRYFALMFVIDRGETIAFVARKFIDARRAAVLWSTRRSLRPSTARCRLPDSRLPNPDSRSSARCPVPDARSAEVPA